MILSILLFVIDFTNFNERYSEKSERKSFSRSSFASTDALFDDNDDIFIFDELIY